MIDPSHPLEMPEENRSSSTNGASAPSAAPSPTYKVQPDELHDLFAVHGPQTGSEDDDPLAALRNDPNYSALIRDLEYIAKQARLLFEPAAQDTPSDEVWAKIQSQLGTLPPDA